MAAERAATEAARAADAAGQRVVTLSTQLAAAAMQVQGERSQREAEASMNHQVQQHGCNLTPVAASNCEWTAHTCCSHHTLCQWRQVLVFALSYFVTS
jgi:hypothetical protein